MWMLDFTNVVQGLRSVWQEPIDIGDDLHYFAQKISLPPVQIDTMKVMVGSVPVSFPGMDAVMGDLRIDFLHEIPPPGGRQRSRIYFLMNLWKACVRAGRTGLTLDNLITPLSPPNNGTGSMVPQFKYDIGIKLLRGLGSQEAAIINSSINSNDPSVSDIELPTAASYIAKDCWIKELSLDGFDHNSKGEPTLIKTAFAVRNIIQLANDSASDSSMKNGGLAVNLRQTNDNINTNVFSGSGLT
jgi:hypothetical protein